MRPPPSRARCAHADHALRQRNAAVVEEAAAPPPAPGRPRRGGARRDLHAVVAQPCVAGAVEAHRRLGRVDLEAVRVARDEERREGVLCRRSSVAATSRNRSARSAKVMRCFSPVIRHVSPSRSARECRSRPVPPACSVSANATTVSPVAMSATICCLLGLPEARQRAPRPFVRCTSIRPGAGPDGGWPRGRAGGRRSTAPSRRTRPGSSADSSRARRRASGSGPGCARWPRSPAPRRTPRRKNARNSSTVGGADLDIPSP